jgi:uncharacterized protein (DUF433 family)
MSQVITFRLGDTDAAFLKRYAKRLGRKPSDVARILIDQGLRQAEFAHIDFRDSAAGRQAYIKGRRSPVWMVVMIAEEYDNDAVKTARHFQWPVELVQAAFNYARAFPQEIREAIEENDSITFEDLQRKLPSIQPLAPNRPKKAR